MRSICFFSLMNGAAWGGSEQMWYRLALWMSQNGYAVSIVCFDWPQKKERLEVLEKAGCTVHKLPGKKGLLYAVKLKRAIKSIPFESFDLVFVNQGGYKEVVYSPFRLLWKRFRKYVLASHNYDTGELLSDSKIAALKNWVLHAALQIGASQKIFDHINDLIGLPYEKQEVWPNPVSFPVPVEPPPFPTTDQWPVRFVMLAELDTHRKAQDLLIKVFSLKKWKDRNWQFYLYGHGKDDQKLREMVHEQNMNDQIQFKGYTTHVAQVLAEAHVVLQCTRIDAMPISVMEAMAMARPCVISNVGDMPLWIENEISGFIVDPLNYEMLEAAMERCWAQKEKWKQMGIAAYQRFKSKYPEPYEDVIVGRLRNL